MKDLSKVSLAIFDMDGLMFDTERITLGAWQKAGRDFKYDIPESALISLIGLNIRDAEIVMKERLGSSFPYKEIRKRRIEYVGELLKDDGVPVKKGLYELLDFLEHRSIPKAVATSTDRERTERMLSSANIRDRFNTIVCGDEIERGKPEPDIFLAAANKLSCPPEECIVLEDSQHGIIAASKAGMYPFLVPDIRQLPEDIEGLAYKKFDSLLEVKGFLKDVCL